MAFQFVEGVHLLRTDETIDEIEGLARLLGGRVGVEGVLGDLNRLGKRARSVGLKVDRAFRWNDDDQASQRWWPQGISTSADASDKEDFGGHRVLATSWYSKSVGGLNKGSRITFVDLDTLRYRHVLLVVPSFGPGGSVVLKSLNVHAGGIVWCGPYLHIAGTKKGIFTCRIDDIMRVPPEMLTDDRDTLGVTGEGDGTRVSTYGYPYVLPVRFSYESHADDGHEQMRYSFLSLDRSASPPELVAGEYGRGEQTTRLVRYPLDPETLHLVSGDDGFARPLLLETQGVGNMQGAAIVRGVWYITRSRGPFALGTVYVGTPGKFKTHRFATPVGPEDISYWPSTDTLWSVSEWPGRRYVFAMGRAQFD